ncbi:MAG: peptidoglycan DD-metalloendopeptidase family protein [Candidatus Paceibacterota bacterium]
MFKTVALGFFAFALTFALANPQTAEAGIFSFLFGSTDNKNTGKDMTASVVNSQTMSLLQAATNPDPNPAKGGSDITIVGGIALLSDIGPSGTAADIEDGHDSGHISLYVVRSGDSIGKIAKMFGVTSNTIIWANDIRNSIIKEGDTLIILPVTGIRYVVVKGDTIQSVVKKYKGDLNEVLQFNNLTESSVLAVGDVVIIPDADMAYPKYSDSITSPEGYTNKSWGTGGPNYKGYYIRPIVGGVKTQGLHGWNGVDLASAINTPIMAAADGTVIISKNSGWNGGYGNYVVISHPNNTQTVYGHMTRTIVYSGQPVVQGQVIGYMGSTGHSTGSHVHFEIRGAKNPF